MIAIIDYGLGNSQAFVTLFDRLGFSAVRARRSQDLLGATKLVLPGVGSFDHAMELLEVSGLRPELERLVNREEVPVLGVCVGMQILANRSDEGHRDGLGWISGTVRALASEESRSSRLPTPHMGWNNVQPINNSGLLAGLDDSARFYFLHSYYFDCDDAAHVIATVDYGMDFPCGVQRDNVFGAQFHPEKSHHWGGLLLKNFAEL